MAFIKFKFEEDEPEEPLFGTGPSEDEIDKSAIDSSFPAKEEKEDFVIDWEKRLGFSRNPFVDEIQKPIEKFIAGYKDEREKLNLFIIESQKFGTISGRTGYGKSTLFCWLENNLKKFSRKIIVLNISGNKLNEGRGFLLEIIRPFLSIIERTIKKNYLSMTLDELSNLIKNRLGSKKIVLLVDDFSGISKQNLVLLQNLLSAVSIRVIFAGTQGQIEKFKSLIDSQPKEARDNFHDHLNIDLKGLSFDDMRSMIQKRVEFYGGIAIEPFNEPYLKKLYKKVEASPKRMLNFCNDEAMKLSVDPETIKKLREESEETKSTVYSDGGYEHKQKQSEYDSIEIIKHEQKEPIVITEDKPKFEFSFKD